MKKNLRRRRAIEQRTLGIWRKLGLAFVFLWFFIGGIAHFAATDLEMRIVPPWLPEPRLMVLVSGVFELLGAIGVLMPRTRQVAGYGLMLLTIAVTPANIYMWQQASQFPAIPYWALTLRLPLQVALLACIGWSTRDVRRRPPAGSQPGQRSARRKL
ncbi:MULTISPECIES: DoxX family protein [Paraburkholderia]|uniref:DoxX-like family protein n=2 Tax=Paraburkholderia TaxID=1822464 RepID=A0ABW9D4Q6_9BURK|nr:putative membrane protein [Paraburkholderia bryophila]NYH20888.1 putative membrane protein [Paraburkholderia bryophila]